jgi:hypothetical protein
MTFCAFASTPASASSLLLGQTVECQYLFPTIGSDYSNAANGQYVLGPGVEVSNIVDERGWMDISDTNLTVHFTAGAGFTSGSFNGFRITDTSLLLFGTGLVAVARRARGKKSAR